MVIPCRNESKHIGNCLRSIMHQAKVHGGIEVVVADGMSNYGTRELLDQLCENEPRMLVIDNPRRIVSAGLNLAIKSAQADVIIRMDAHTEYAPDYIKKCLEILEQTGADNVGGPARTKAITYLERAVAAAYHSPFSVGGAKFHFVNYEGYVDTVTYGCWHKTAFERFGYFDEELIRNQDDEHNLRIIRGGGKIWQSPKIKSWYRPRNSLRALFKQYMQYGYWKVRVIQKHKFPASLRHLVPGGFVLTLLLLLLASGLGHVILAPTHPFPWVQSLVDTTFTLALGSYLLVLLVAATITAIGTEGKLLPMLPLVFGCYHFGYGYGFLHGVWDFLIRRRKLRTSFESLSR